MEKHPTPCGWQLHHSEQIAIRASIGAPTIRLKFFHYPSYRQKVIVNQPPRDCKLKTNRDNRYYLFQQKVRTKGTISLKRIISVYPMCSTSLTQFTWGRISDIPKFLQRKYKQNFPYWPLDSPAIQHISQERWFSTDDLFTWTQAAYNTITKKIKYPEKQNKRLGADQVLRTGSGDCDEFTDLFITLARIRGIPARRITGYFIRQTPNGIEPHAWAEFSSPTLGWIPIDIALRNIGNHTIHYVIGKIEEFTPSIQEYQLLPEVTAVHGQWHCPIPLVTPLYE